MSVVLTCFALLPSVQAVTPAPDGAYPENNTAEGSNALLHRTTGGFDTAIGADALLSDTTGDSNTAVGANSLRLLTTGSGNTALGVQALFYNNANGNTAVGGHALFSNTTGDQNVAIGQRALANNTDGENNTASGFQALYRNSGSENTATGSQALFNNQNGFENTSVGFQALFSNTTGSFNVAVGGETLKYNTTGFNNTATGAAALASNRTGFANTANGCDSLFANTTGAADTATGAGALADNRIGNSNTATGAFALNSNISGNNNTAIGQGALSSNQTGNNNTAIGEETLLNNNGSGNVALGSRAGVFLTGDNNIDIANEGPFGSESNTIRIGFVQTRTFIAGIRGRTTGNVNAVPILIDSAGQLGTAGSSRRYKDEIKPMDKTSEAILALKPVTFHYKSDKKGTPQFGLIAEEVAAVNPDLVVRDEDGDIYTVRYDAVNAMLLNEFLKEHRKMQELEANTVRQQKQIDALAAGLQKVSAQLEVRKAKPQAAENNQ
jgi:hypothetical protein